MARSTTPDVNVVTDEILLPFQPSVANYDFSCSINDVTYQFRVLWNDRANVDPITGAAKGAWYFDVAAEDGTPIISGVKVVLGAYLGRRSNDDLFRQGVILAYDTSGNEQDAGFDDIGVNADGTTNRVVVKYIPVLELVRRLQG